MYQTLSVAQKRAIDSAEYNAEDAVITLLSIIEELDDKVASLRGDLDTKDSQIKELELELKDALMELNRPAE